MPHRHSIGLVRGLIGIAVLLFLFVTPPGQHLFFAATNWLGHLISHALLKSLPSPSTKP